MARERRQPPQDEPSGAPEWMVTFSDCMTLLLTFFVLLLSFSSFDERIYRKLNVIYCDAFPTIHSRRKASKEAFVDFNQRSYEIEKGSEKPTLEDGQQGTLTESDLPAFKKNRTFIKESQGVFWGKGTTISTDGHKMLSALADFLRKVPGQVVISENSRDRTDKSRDFGLTRSWQVVQFLTVREGLEKSRFNISAGTTIGNKAFDILRLDEKNTNSNRILEIVLLDRSVCN